MTSSRIHICTIVIVFSAILCFLSSCNNQGSQKSIYLAHSLSTSHPVHAGLEFFRDDLLERSSGKLLVKIFPDGQLGTERQVLELLQIGSIAMTKVSAAVMANFVPDYRVLGVPYLFRDKDHMFKVLEGEIGKDLLLKGEDNLLRGLCYYDAGSRSFYTVNKPIHTPDDLKGMKIRVMNHQMSVEMVNGFGASATPMSFGELYTALQQGVVDGAENNPPSLVSSNHYEVCGYYTLDEHSSVPDVVVMGTRFWNRLSIEEQEWVEASAFASAQAQKEFWRKSVKECMQVLEDAGVEVIRPNKESFAQATASVIDKFVRENDAANIIREIQKVE